MRLGGHTRTLLARTLGAAYAVGLLSEDTYTHRVDDLLAARVIEPGRLDGDLNFRGRGGWTARVAGLRGTPLERRAPRPETVLARPGDRVALGGRALVID